MAHDLRTFLKAYGDTHPEDVCVLDAEVRAAYDLTALVAALDAQEAYPALVAPHVVLPDGRRAALPVVTNLFASRARCAAALGSAPERAGRDYYARLQGPPLAPEVVPAGEAPVREAVTRGDAVDLTALPALVHHRLDPGPYITAGFFLCHDPDSGIENCSLARGWVCGPREIRVWLDAHSHNMRNWEKHAARGETMRVAFIQGHHAAVLLGLQVKLGYPESHYSAAGKMLGEPLHLTPSVTWGDAVLVPADAELVIEGEMAPGQRAAEGPFGEFTGYSGPQVASPVLRVTALTHRADAYWHDIQVGYADTAVMGGLAIEGAVFEAVRRRVPSLVNVHLPLSGKCRFHCYLQLDHPAPGEAREAIILAATAHKTVKHVIAVDADIDIFSESEVLWAVATRSQWDRDLVVLPDLPGTMLDPSVDGPRTAKGGIDATMPSGAPYALRNRLPSTARPPVDVTALVRRLHAGG